jgi:uroporphyrinogen-III synthase
MYLVCCPKDNAHEIINVLQQQNIATCFLDLLDIEYFETNFKLLEQSINRFEYIVFSSALAIEHAKDIIHNTVHATFITVGSASARRIKKYTNNQVIYPTQTSGAKALIETQLKYIDFSNKNILMIKGEGGNDELDNYFKTINVIYVIIEVYKRVYKHIAALEFKKIILQPQLQGIIITSSGLVDWLFHQAQLNNCLDWLKKLTFYTLHEDIKKQLHDFGVIDVVLINEFKQNLPEVLQQRNDTNKLNII